jgi:predicted nucleic acid-binding protein
MIVLVDTNIVLDVIQKRQAHYAAAEETWKRVEERSLDGRVSAITFNNVFYILRKQVGVDPARDALRAIRRTCGVVPLDQAIIDDAIAAAEADFEDSIQIAAARLATAAYIVTRNVRHFASSPIPAVTANDLISILEP